MTDLSKAAAAMGRKGGKIGGAKTSAKKTAAVRGNIKKRWAGVPVELRGDEVGYHRPQTKKECQEDAIAMWGAWTTFPER